jgi:hypothetical protein
MGLAARLAQSGHELDPNQFRESSIRRAKTRIGGSGSLRGTNDGDYLGAKGEGEIMPRPLGGDS